MEEIWLQIKEYPLYSVSNTGKVKNNITQKILKNNLSTGGYPQVIITNGKRKCFPIHRLVALRFIPNILNLAEVNHIDGNKQNNNVTNLEWCTRKQNQDHSILIGLKTYDSNRGSKNYCSKLTEDDVLEIIKSYNSTKITHRRLAEKYNVSKSAITNILTGKRWKKISNINI